MKYAGRISRMAEIRHAHKSLLGKPEGTWLLGKASFKRGDNAKVDLKVECECVNWIQLGPFEYGYENYDSLKSRKCFD
jgi:hypothetical protein